MCRLSCDAVASIALIVVLILAIFFSVVGSVSLPTLPLTARSYFVPVEQKNAFEPASFELPVTLLIPKSSKPSSFSFAKMKVMYLD